MPPTRHSMTEMHRSTNDVTGANITVGYAPLADGSGGVDWGAVAAASGSGIVLFLDHGTVGASEDIDQSAAAAHWITLDVNCTLTFSGAVATVDGDPVECAFRLYVEQDGSGTNVITWPGSVVWPDGVAPTLDTTGGSVEVLDFTTPDGGTTWYGFHGGTGSGTSADDANIWRPVMDGAGAVITDGTGQAVMAYGPA